jgi:hypothetical protein
MVFKGLPIICSSLCELYAFVLSRQDAKNRKEFNTYDFSLRTQIDFDFSLCELHAFVLSRQDAKAARVQY